MAWQFVVDGKGREWAVDPDLMYALVRANYRAVELRRRMRVDVEHHTLGPDLTNVLIDYEGLRSAVDRGAADWWQETRNRLSVLPGEQVVQDLALLRGEERAKTKEVLDAQLTASRATQNAIAASVNRGEIAETIATWTRDLSAGTLMAGATLLTGGAAAAVLSAGAGLKGVAKYQDTGNVGSAIIEASTNMIVGAIGIAGTAASIAKQALAENVLIVLSSTIDATMEGGKAIIEGKDTVTAAKLTAMRFGVDVASAKLPFGKFGAWTKLRTLVTGGTALAGDKAVGAVAPGPPKLPAQPATRKTSWSTGDGGVDMLYVGESVLRPVATMPGFAGKRSS